MADMVTVPLVGQAIPQKVWYKGVSMGSIIFSSTVQIYIKENVAAQEKSYNLIILQESVQGSSAVLFSHTMPCNICEKCLMNTPVLVTSELSAAFFHSTHRKHQ